MVATVEDLKKAGIKIPVMVGGAALSRKFTNTRIAPAYDGPAIYATDAMNGLALAKRIQDSRAFKILKSDLAKEQAQQDFPAVKKKVFDAGETRSPQIEILAELPTAPYYDRHVLVNTPVQEIWAYINPRMLYGKHLGLKGPTIAQWQRNGLDALKKDK